MKKQYIRELAENAQVNDLFLAYDVQKRTNRDGAFYLTMMLRDRTGSMRAILWGYKENEHGSIPPEGYVRVKGTVGEYNRAPQMRLVSIAPANEPGLDSTEFLPESAKNAEEVIRGLQELSGEIADPHLSKLIGSLLGDAAFIKEFRRAPAAVSIHHAFIGGLMEHTLNVSLVAKALAKVYGNVDKDLLISGAILHDAGKIREYDYMTAFRFSTQGRLMGHHVLGCEIVRDAAAKIPGFPAETLMKLEHMILSHHGTKEWGSPVEPMFMEAMLLHCADLIDARHHVYATAEPEPASGGWSQYDKQLGHYIYLGPDGDSE